MMMRRAATATATAAAVSQGNQTESLPLTADKKGHSSTTTSSITRSSWMTGGLFIFVALCVWTLWSRVAHSKVPKIPFSTAVSEIKAMSPQNVTVVVVLPPSSEKEEDSSDPLQDLLPNLLDHAQIQQVILLPLTTDGLTTTIPSHSKLTHYEVTQQQLQRMGSSIRFWVAGYKAQTPWVMLVNARQIRSIPTATLDALLQEYQSNPYRIIGIQGRDLNHFGMGALTHGYTPANTRGPTEVILGSALLMEKELCANFHLQSHVVESESILRPSAKNALKWNMADDIFMSLVANFWYGSDVYQDPIRGWANEGINNYAMDWLPVDMHDNDNDMLPQQPWTWRPWDGFWRRHYSQALQEWEYRGKLWKLAKKHLHTYAVRGD